MLIPVAASTKFGNFAAFRSRIKPLSMRNAHGDSMDRAISAAMAFWRCRSGATSIEYAIIASVISISIVAGAKAIGVNITNVFYNKLASNM